MLPRCLGSLSAVGYAAAHKGLLLLLKTLTLAKGVADALKAPYF